MANKTKRKVKIGRKTIKTKQQTRAVARKPATPFGDAGAIAGNALGQMFNMPFLKGAGRFLGSGIGSIFGSGDYTLTGAVPEYNVLTNSKQIPQFSTSHATNLVCHREYLGDITGTTTFSNRSYPLNPGNSKTFPWLSTIAQNYQQYKIHGIIFEFRPLITDFVTAGSPGVVVMATNYNANAAPYDTKQEMENSEFAVSVKPTNALIHGVECAKGETVLINFMSAKVPLLLGKTCDCMILELSNLHHKLTQSRSLVNFGLVTALNSSSQFYLTTSEVTFYPLVMLARLLMVRTDLEFQHPQIVGIWNLFSLPPIHFNLMSILETNTSLFLLGMVLLLLPACLACPLPEERSQHPQLGITQLTLLQVLQVYYGMV